MLNIALIILHLYFVFLLKFKKHNLNKEKETVIYMFLLILSGMICATQQYPILAILYAVQGMWFAKDLLDRI